MLSHDNRSWRFCCNGVHVCVCVFVAPLPLPLSISLYVRMCVCMCVYTCICVRACMRARACVCACLWDASAHHSQILSRSICVVILLSNMMLYHTQPRSFKKSCCYPDVKLHSSEPERGSDSFRFRTCMYDHCVRPPMLRGSLAGAMHCSR